LVSDNPVGDGEIADLFYSAYAVYENGNVFGKLKQMEVGGGGALGMFGCAYSFIFIE
jgi:hypothetical protein